MTNPYDQSPIGDNGYGQQQPYGYNYNPQQSWTPPPAPDYSAGHNYPPPPGAYYREQKPDNMLVWTILSTVLCCWPVAACGIYYSTQVDTLWGQGRYEEAKKAARTAKILAITSTIPLVSLIIIYLVFVMIAVAMGW